MGLILMVMGMGIDWYFTTWFIRGVVLVSLSLEGVGDAGDHSMSRGGTWILHVLIHPWCLALLTSWAFGRQTGYLIAGCYIGYEFYESLKTTYVPDGLARLI
jgi:hypothetical protein